MATSPIYLDQRRDPSINAQYSPAQLPYVINPLEINHSSYFTTANPNVPNQNFQTMFTSPFEFSGGNTEQPVMMAQIPVRESSLGPPYCPFGPPQTDPLCSFPLLQFCQKDTRSLNFQTTKRQRNEGKNLRLITILKSYKSTPQQIFQSVEMIMSSETLSEREVTICIGAYRRTGQWKRARMLLQEMKVKGLKPNVINYSAVISACEKAQRWEKAIELLHEMKEEGIQPNVISYSAAISACEKCQRYKEALSLLSEMKAAGITPDAIAYNATISAMEKGHQGEQAIQLLNEMLQNNVTATVISYNATISACEKSLLWEKALDVFECMKKNNVAPDMITYNALISACCKSQQYELALEKFHEMQKSNMTPDVVTFCPLIWTCMTTNRHAEAWDLYMHMRQLKVKPNMSLFRQLAHHFDSREDCPKFEILVNDMASLSKKHSGLILHICNMAMRLCIRLGCYTNCLSFFQKTYERHVTPDMDGFSMALEACAVLGNAYYANTIMDRIIQLGLTMTNESLTMAIISNTISYQYDQALYLLNASESLNVKVDIHMINALVEGANFMNKYDEVYKLESLMISKELQPTKTTCVLLITGFSSAGDDAKTRYYVSLLHDVHGDEVSEEEEYPGDPDNNTCDKSTVDC